MQVTLALRKSAAGDPLRSSTFFLHCHLRRIPNASFLGRLEPEIKHPDRRAHEIPIITSARGLQTYHMAPDLLHTLAVEWTPRVTEVDDYLENTCPLKAVVGFGKGGRVTCPTRA